MVPRILIVDDDPIVRDVLQRMFDEIGYATCSTATGEEAVALMMGPETPFEIVLVDMTMSGMDGIQTCQMIRKIRPEIRVLLMSGYAEDQLLATPIVKHLVDGFVHKPFKLKDLNDMVLSLLGSPEATKEREGTRSEHSSQRVTQLA